MAKWQCFSEVSKVITGLAELGSVAPHRAYQMRVPSPFYRRDDNIINIRDACFLTAQTCQRTRYYVVLGEQIVGL